MRFPQTIDLAPYMSRIHHQLRSKKTRGPDVAASVSRLICMRCHDNTQSDTPQSNTECRTDITIRARTVYTPNVTHAHIVNNNQEENYIIASVIRDLLTMKYDNMYIPEHQRFLNDIDIQHMLTLLCTM